MAIKSIVLLLFIGVVIMECAKKESVITDYAPVEQVRAQSEKLVPVEIRYDKSVLSEK